MRFLGHGDGRPPEAGCFPTCLERRPRRRSRSWRCCIPRLTRVLPLRLRLARTWLCRQRRLGICTLWLKKRRRPCQSWSWARLWLAESPGRWSLTFTFVCVIGNAAIVRANFFTSQRYHEFLYNNSILNRKHQQYSVRFAGSSADERTERNQSLGFEQLSVLISRNVIGYR